MGGISFLFLPLIGDMTVIALIGLAYSAATADGGVGNEVCRADGLRLDVGRSKCCAMLGPGGGEYGGGGDGRGAIQTDEHTIFKKRNRLKELKMGIPSNHINHAQKLSLEDC
jgi:hypothetical protein